MDSTAPGGYSTESINISFPGTSARSFCMTGTTTCASATRCALPATTSIVPRIRRYDMAALLAIRGRRDLGIGPSMSGAAIRQDRCDPCAPRPAAKRVLLDPAAPVSSLEVIHYLGCIAAHRHQIAGRRY